jgi:hypothetical protein
MWWEFGEHAAGLLEPIGNRLPRWIIDSCACERRRASLNLLGENLWKRRFPRSALRCSNRFREVVLRKLDSKVTPEGQLHALLHQSGIRICLATMRRWLKPLPIRSIPGKETLFGLPYKT